MMDIQSAVIGAAVFIISAGVLLFISMFGIKEKSYEEALAEQRQQSNTLLGIQRTKPKEKKVKKANKKIKEKQQVTPLENETAEESEDTESPTSSMSSTTLTHSKQHVEFKEPAVVDLPVVETQTSVKKRGKKDKVKPILIHKVVEKPVITIPTDVPPANHFEQLHPKDEFELLHSQLHTKEEVISKTEVVKEKVNKPKQNGTDQEHTKEKGNKVRHNSLDGKEVKVKQLEPVKEKINKEKQTHLHAEVPKPKKLPNKSTVTQLTAEKEEVVEESTSVVPQTNGFVANSGKEKRKKKGDNNALQQLSGSKGGEVNLAVLLNAVRKAELSRSEVQILIDLLLNKQHEAPEVLDEWSEGKADPIQKLRKQLAEKEKALTEEQEALLGVQTKLREVRAEQIAEKSQLQQRTRSLEEALQAKQLELQAINNRLHTQNQKMQQMQAQLNEEAVTMRKLHEENSTLQLQLQQIDIHITQTQEAEATIQDLQSRNNQLTMELHSLTEQNLVAKDHQQGLIVQLQHQVNHFKSELDEKENINHQFEELHRDLEHRLALALRQENDLKHEISQLQSVCQKNMEDIRHSEHAKAQYIEEIRNLQKQNEDLNTILAQLKVELQEVQTEKSELQHLKANGLAQENETHKEELLNLHNELSSVKSKLQLTEKKYGTELDASRNLINQLQTELDEQKNKNNELRKKNWKVMDALKAAECRNSDLVKKPTTNVDEIVTRVKTEEQESHKNFIQRLFPDIKTSDGLSYEEWLIDVESTINSYVKKLEAVKAEDNSQEVSNLQAQIQHYKNILENTEEILKSLENQVEQEERKWRKELKTKEIEIATLKQRHFTELQTKVETLISKLATEVEEKNKISNIYEKLKNKELQTEKDLEKLSEEVTQLNEQLLKEQEKYEELVKQSVQKANDVNCKEPLPLVEPS